MANNRTMRPATKLAMCAILATASLASLSAVHAQPAEEPRELILIPDGGNSLFVDAVSLRRGGRVAEANVISAPNQQGAFSIMHVRLDCASRTMSMTEMRFVDASGNISAPEQGPTGALDPNNRQDASVYGFFCGSPAGPPIRFYSLEAAFAYARQNR